ncbi:MAG: DNA mismatch repair endonuclease MutL [Rikenellaceae bacterium]
MSDKIKLLPDLVANQIAAGEVVNRPSSVIKEMMENSIDAGASCIIVNFREGGGDLIQIVDDGCGMSPNDARMAFERHATSKISSADDIYDLHTFGFRGEALASIAAVSQVELRSRQENDGVGTSTRVNGGEYQGQEPIMCETGSQFFVRNLFYNVPARRRFMERVTTSTNQIKADFKRIALCNPDIHFELYSNDSPLYNLPRTSLVSRIVDVVGRSIKHNLLELHTDTSIAKLRGYIGRPAAAKKTNNDQYFFVNGRFFRSTFFTKAILKGYDKLIPVGSTPSYFIYIEVDPERIDVNVHPQKTEVKFADNDDIWQIIVAAVRETLAKTGVVPMMDFDNDSPIEIPLMQEHAVVKTPAAFSSGGYNPFNEGYVDPSAPDPNVDFTGFDVPYNIGDELHPAEKNIRHRSELKDGAYASMIGNFGADISSSIPSASSPSSFSASDFESIESGINVEREVEMPIVTEITPISEESFDSSSFEFVESAMEPTQIKITPPIEVHSVTPLGGGYAFMIADGGAVIIDVARAKERVLYDRYLAAANGQPAACQQLLFPEQLILSHEEYATIEERVMDFVVVGFDFDFLGNGSVEVKGIPPEIKREEVDKLIYELIEAAATPEEFLDLRRDKMARIMAKSGAAVAHRGLNVEQVKQLAEQLFQSGNIAHTPSGKPLVWQITQSEIMDKLR